MKIIDIDIDKIELEEVNDLHLCLGYFDGVHLGHQALINKAIEAGKAGVMTFDVPPNFALGIKTVNSCLGSLYDKANLLEKMGVKYFYILRMSKELLNMTRDEFIEEILQKINPQKLYVGEDYRFGYQARGDAEYLKRYFDVEVVPLLKIDDKKVSSREIRDLVAEGDVEEASKYLGRLYSITGLVIHGRGNGRLIDFPTANLDLDYPYVLPKIGVYMGYVKLLNSTYKAIIAVSTHPTIMELNKPIVEVHLLYYKGDLYGREIEVEFAAYMRDIFKFDTAEELKAQLEKDRDVAKELLRKKD